MRWPPSFRSLMLCMGTGDKDQTANTSDAAKIVWIWCAQGFTHPSQWEFGGYREIQAPRERHSIIDHRALMGLPGIPSIEALRRSHGAWVGEALARADRVREGKWTESVAHGSRDFVESVKAKLGIRAKGRRISGMDGESSLCEPQASYSDDFNA
jgi:putative transposase